MFVFGKPTTSSGTTVENKNMLANTDTLAEMLMNVHCPCPNDY